jgi:hypothetical protein
MGGYLGRVSKALIREAVIADLAAGLFCVEGPMTDDRWLVHRAHPVTGATRPAPIESGSPASTSERTGFAGVPPGSIVRPTRMTGQLPSVFHSGAAGRPTPIYAGPHR